jgi:hypothetical protein
MTSWQVRLAALLAWFGVLPGLGCFYLASLAFKANDMLLIVMPIVGSAALVAGFLIVGGSVSLALGLQQGHRTARLRALLAGVGLAMMGLFTMAVTPGVGFLLLLYGGLLAFLVSTPEAAQDLGPWRRAVQQPAPWGGTPGQGLWAPAQRPEAPWAAKDPTSFAAPQQGPWAPDPRTLPWFSWKNHSGPRAPWWQTWQAGLAQGIPLWELVLLVLALLGFLVGLVTIPIVLKGSAFFANLHLSGSRAAWLLVLLPVSWAVVAWLEQRMRTRLATRS